MTRQRGKGGELRLTLCPADRLHDDVVLVDLVLVMLELPFQ